jgi:hypothetical protein
MREEGWRAPFDQGASLFIGRGGAAALGAGRRWSRRSRAAKGQVMGSERGRRQGEAGERRGEAGEGAVASLSSSDTRVLRRTVVIRDDGYRARESSCGCLAVSWW